MNEKYLPVGTVVTLEEATKKVMIMGYFPMSKDNKIFDYNACLYPEGVLDANKTLAFNHDKIKEVNHMGLADEEYKNFNEQLKGMVNGIEALQKIELPKEENNQAVQKDAPVQTTVQQQAPIPNDIADIMGQPVTKENTNENAQN